MKPGWKKQQEKKEKKEMRKLMTDKEIAITRIMEKKEDNDDAEDLIELRAIEEMVSSVVVTTRPMSNSSINGKISQEGYLVGNMSCVIHKRT